MYSNQEPNRQRLGSSSLVDDAHNPSYSAFLHQSRGADELFRYRMSQSNVSQLHTDENWPLQTVDIAETPKDEWIDESPNTPRHISTEGLLSHTESTHHSWERRLSAPQAYRGSEYLDDLVSHYLSPQRSSPPDGDKTGLGVHVSPIRRRSCRSSPRSSFRPYTLILFFLASAFATFTAVYASANIDPFRFRFFSSSSSHSLLLLRVVSEGSTILLWALMLKVMEELQWALASRRNGENLMQFLSLDMGTGCWGLLRLLRQSPWKYKSTVLIRYVRLR
jgi:hypothetical protein